MNNNSINFIQQNSPCGGFLQLEEWKKFQEAVGRRTFNVSNDDLYASIIEHKLPIVGKYFYIPRGPIMAYNIKHKTCNIKIQEIIKLAKENNAGWIRIEPATDEILKEIKNNINYKVAKAPHDMQPREILVMDITKPEEQLLSEMKSKTRYNIRLAEKKEVRIKKKELSGEYMDDFIRLTKVMAKRQGISAHPDEYYQKMVETIPEDILKLYVAEYKDKIIAANLVVFFGNTCTYLHGASDDEYRNVMAPFLLQWKQIKDAKRSGCENYDFGGVKTRSKNKEEKSKQNSWEGITRFKTGFVPNIRPVEFPGSYDIIINRKKYFLYRFLQRVKNIF